MSTPTTMLLVSSKQALATAWLVLIAAFLLPQDRAAAVTRARSSRNCSRSCGGYHIPYPFGIGPRCSLPGFSLTCAGDKSPILLGNPPMQVAFPFDNPWPWFSIWYSVKMIPGVQDYSFHWEAPARPFAISGLSNMSMFLVGCGVKATMFIGNSSFEVGRCSAVCGEARAMENLPVGKCHGTGCCRIDIQVNLRAFTLNISRISDSTWSNEVVASIGYTDLTFRPIDALRLNGDGENILPGLEELQPNILEWAIPYQPDCQRAMEDKASYACVSNRSKCQDSPIGGYVCHCLWGNPLDGNPYIDDGCPEYQRATPPLPPPPRPPVLSYGSIQPRMDCPTSCGNVSIPFPFGTEIGCFAKLDLYLACMPGTMGVQLVLELSDGTVVTDISIDDGVLHVRDVPEQGVFMSGSDSNSTLYTSFGKWGTLKWTIDNVTCQHAKQNKSDYRCFGSHSDCLDVTDDGTLKHIGYRCKCSYGFEGNPYIKDGCTDTNECLQPHKYICNGICHNKFGSYTCTSTVILGVIIGLSSGGCILFFSVVVGILYRRWSRVVQKRLRKRYFRKNKGILLEQLISSDTSASEGRKIFSLEELEKATNNFNDSRVVGRGGHGTVYKGILTDQRVVAIKKSTRAVMSEIEQFINEVSILSQINHRNVVKLHGCCLESEIPLLVYEFVSNGTLYDLLHCQQELPLSWEERLRIATEIAGALAYLHSAASVSILHRDVKCMNVLLNDSHTVKVSDFGASRLIPVDQTHLVTAVQGTFGYLDPEYYHTGQLNEKSDVYSFGVVLVELLTRRKPIIQNEHGEKQSLSNYFLWAMRERPLKEIVDAHISLEEEGVLSMARLAEECLGLTRGARPTMKDVEMRLQLLTGRRVAPRDQVARPRCEAPEDDEPGAAAVAQQGSRQYSQEQEFMSSLRVPR